MEEKEFSTMQGSITEGLLAINQKQEKDLMKQLDTQKRQAEKLKRINDEIVEMLGTVVDLRDEESGEHVQRVRAYSGILAKYVMENFPRHGLTEQNVKDISLASSMHDMGKIMVPDAVLRKPGRLTPEEYDEIKKHSANGVKVLEHAPKDWPEEFRTLAEDICLNHHEKWDGTGYPNGRKGDEIPIAAQIVSVADCYDALTQDRVYRKAIDPDTSVQMILDGKCGAFSPEILEAFVACKSLFALQLRGQLPGEEVPEEEAEEENLLKGLRILIVDDNDFSRELNGDTLTDEGVIVEEAEDGSIALKKVMEDEPYDAVLMDLVMPVMDGIEATAAIRAYEKDKEYSTPILALTADPREERARKCLETGANAIMAKPLVVSELTSILLKLRSGSTAAGSVNADSLTMVKNITAYTDMVSELTEDLKGVNPPSFAVVLCDVNNLRTVNETEGLEAGDRYIKNCVSLILSTFSTSPVYRVGGDEFIIIVQGKDYDNLNRCFRTLKEKEEEAYHLEGCEVGRTAFSAGMAEYDVGQDITVSDVLKRAELSMFDDRNKKQEQRQ